MQASSVVARCQPWFYLRLVAHSFFWLIRTLGGDIAQGRSFSLVAKRKKGGWVGAAFLGVFKFLDVE